jgi:hypothetical protein
MMERAECLQQLQELQKSEREAAAEALKHRQNLEMANTEKKSLADRVKFLEADNAKLSAENVQVCLLLSIAAHPCAQSSTAGALLDALTRGMCWEWAVGGTFQLETAD